MKTGWICPGSADQTAGLERRFVVVEIIDEGLDRFLRKFAVRVVSHLLYENENAYLAAMLNVRQRWRNVIGDR